LEVVLIEAEILSSYIGWAKSE